MLQLAPAHAAGPEEKGLVSARLDPRRAQGSASTCARASSCACMRMCKCIPDTRQTPEKQVLFYNAAHQDKTRAQCTCHARRLPTLWYSETRISESLRSLRWSPSGAEPFDADESRSADVLLAAHTIQTQCHGGSRGWLDREFYRRGGGQNTLRETCPQRVSAQRQSGRTLRLPRCTQPPAPP